jgi:hypothetical protein
MGDRLLPDFIGVAAEAEAPEYAEQECDREGDQVIKRGGLQGRVCRCGIARAEHHAVALLQCSRP